MGHRSFGETGTTLDGSVQPAGRFQLRADLKQALGPPVRSV
jgi:hypothetical protein